MSKSLQSYSLKERPKVVARRLTQNAGGLGYIAATQYQAKKLSGSIKE